MRDPRLSEPSALDALAAWRSLLTELNCLGEVLCAAALANDVCTAIATMMDMRRVRSALARVEAPADARGTHQEHATMREVARSAAGAQLSELAMRQWLTRPLPSQAELLESALGVAVLADSILPEVWDFEADLVILVGRGLEPVAQLLLDLGQRRVVVQGGESPKGAIQVAGVDEVEIAVRSMVPVSPRQVLVHAMVGTDEAFATSIRDAAHDAVSDLRIHRNTMHAFSKTWLEQALANLPGVARWPSVCAFDDTFAKVPMVIVAPGPSLANNAHLLRSLKGRAIVTAFSHSLKPVLAAGITPDLVLTVDPQDVRYHFDDTDVGAMTFVNGVSVHPSLYELPARRCITLSANGSADDWIFEPLGEQPVVPGGGSVATSALSLAIRWKCDPIIFVGLDLSFPEGKYYVATSSDGDARAEVDNKGVMQVAGWSPGFHAMKAAGGPPTPTERFVELPGWHGGTVPSSFRFSLFHRWFEDALSNGAPSTVYNCTEGGAWIEGMTHRPFADVIATLHTTYDVEQMLAAATAAVPADRTGRLTAHLRTQLQQLRRARKLARRARSLIERGVTGPHLTRVERDLADTLRPLGFVALLAQRELERAQDIAHREGSEQSFLAASSRLLQTLVQIIDELGPLIDRAIVRITTPGAP
jgi:hypothetical protein